MSFWDYVFDSEFKQRTDINELSDQSDRAARRLRRDTGKLEERIEDLENELASLSLFSRCLLRVLAGKGVCTPEEWQETIRALDLEDGKLDGR